MMQRISRVLASALMASAGSAHAGAFSAIVRAEAALKQASSWHAVMQMSGGKRLTMDYAAPNRWRVQPTAQITEIIVGNDVYMDMAGHAMKLPPAYGAAIARTIHIHLFDAAQQAQVRSTLRDLGVQKLDGQTVHVYRYVLKGITQTWYVGAHDLPVQAVLSGAGRTTVVQYSRYNVPANIRVPTG
jgi:hypothetical protein